MNKNCKLFKIFFSRKFLTKRQNTINTMGRVLTDWEKLEFVKTSVSWISSKETKDTCFILNFGYEAPLPWPQVLKLDGREIGLGNMIQVRMRLNDADTQIGRQLDPEPMG